MDSGSKFYFAVDFHSTHEDIYYTITPELKGNMPGLVPDLINSIGERLEHYEPNIKPRTDDEPKITSTAYLFFEIGAESFTFEIGDNTPMDFIRRKGEISAMELMRLLQKQPAINTVE